MGSAGSVALSAALPKQAQACRKQHHQQRIAEHRGVDDRLGEGGGSQQNGDRDVAGHRDDAGAARGYFEQHFPDVLAHLPDFYAEWAANPTSSLVCESQTARASG